MIMLKKQIFIIILLLLAAYPIDGLAKCFGGKFRMQGQVVDNFNKPVKGAQIAVSFSKRNRSFIAETDFKGRYVLDVDMEIKSKFSLFGDKCSSPKKVLILILKKGYQKFSQKHSVQSFFFDRPKVVNLHKGSTIELKDVNFQLKRNEIVLHHLSFDAHTFTPVTVKNITRKYQCKFKLSASSSVVKQISKIIDAYQIGKFEHKVVRLKISGLREYALFVDQDGGVLLDKNVNGKLTRAGFKKLKGIMENLEQKRPWGCRV